MSAKKPHHAILSLGITSGFLKDAKLELVDGLNCLIGERGTGKTTVVELLRHALGLMPDAKGSPRGQLTKSLVHTNLGTGRVRLSIQTKHGMTYQVERTLGDAPQVFDEQGNPVPVSLERDTLFGADVYSQHEIEEIATTPERQLDLLDRFLPDGEKRRLEIEERRLLSELDENARELVRVGQESDEFQETASEAAALEQKLGALKETGGPDAKKINTAHAQKTLREKERKTLEAAPKDLARILSDLESTVPGMSRRLESYVDQDLLQGTNKKVLGETAQSLGSIATLLDDAMRKLRAQVGTVLGALAAQERELAKLHAKQEHEFREVFSQSEGARERAAERARIQERYLEVMQAKKELELRAQEREKRQAKRAELVSRLGKLRDERFQARKKVAQRLTTELAPTIHVSVSQAASRQGYRDLLNEAFKQSGMKYSPLVDKLVQRTGPDELAGFLREGDVAELSERLEVEEERARKVLDVLRRPELLYRLETTELGDLPRIELLDGSDYKDSASLSTGQRCTTILPILLLENERPLIIDQPEDNLDNAFIFGTIVKIVRNAKLSRQLIFVTHNPNIPVLGDADRVFVLASDGKHGSVKCWGTVDERREEITTLLEGGEEAFLKRKNRYGF